MPVKLRMGFGARRAQSMRSLNMAWYAAGAGGEVWSE